MFAAARRIAPSVALLMILPVPAALVAQSSEIQRDTLQSLLDKGVAAFRTGDFAGASDFFDSLEHQFGKEPEYDEDAFQQVFLPVRGYSLLMAKMPADAALNYESFLVRFPDDPKTVAFVLYNLAQAYQQSGDLEKAIAAYDRFETAFPGKPEASLSLFKRAELLFKLGSSRDGLEVLSGFYNSDASASLRAQARLRALQETVRKKDWVRARDILFETDWSFETMPELAVQAHSALRVADALLSTGENAAAVRAYRMVSPMDSLMRAQRERLDEVRATFAKRSGILTESTRAIWTEYYRQMIGRIERQLAHMAEGEDYTPGFHLRFGQALLLAGRPRESWIVFETLSEAPTLSSEIRQEAHYRWILAAQSLERWEDSLRIARSFGRRYAGSHLIADALFLTAHSYRGNGEFGRAVEVLSDLVREYPDHSQLPRWIFTRGFCSVLNGGFADAREDFRIYLERWPSGGLRINAGLWHALSWYHEKAYPEARRELEKLVRSSRGTPLEPEVNYRLAATCYAMGEFDDAVQWVDGFLRKFPGHSREPEVAVLRGDILMGRGELIAAAVAFAQVPPEAGRLFPYAVFQTGKIFRALEEYERMIEHFTNYVERDDLAARPRVSEALYWAGWAYQQRGRPSDALPVFLGALAEYGDDRESGEMHSILQALARLFGGNDRFVEDSLQSEDADPFTGGFDNWLDSERRSARRDGKLTYFSRLSVFLSRRLEHSGRIDEAESILLEVADAVAVEHHDAVGLGRLGMLLDKLQFPSAETYFYQILERYPETPQRAIAYFGLGKLNIRRERLAAAGTWLAKVRDETPMHSLAADAALLRGEVHLALSSPGEAITEFENLLRLKSARGRPHANALSGLARAYRVKGDIEKAIAYYQRIYTLYRAYSDLVSDAYIESAALFAELGDIQAAYDSLGELLSEPGMKDSDAYRIAEQERKRLEPILLEEQGDFSGEKTEGQL